MDNDSRVRQDYSHYRFMLVSLRRTEESYGDASKIAFLLQVKYAVKHGPGRLLCKFTKDHRANSFQQGNTA